MQTKFELKLKQRSNGVHYAFGYIAGERVRKSLGTTDKKVARDLLNEMIAEVAKNGKVLDHKATMEDVAEKYFLACEGRVENKVMKAKSPENYKFGWEGIKRCKPGIEKLKPSQVNTDEFLASIRIKTVDGRDPAAGTFNMYMDGLRGILKHAQGLGLIHSVIRIAKRKTPWRKVWLDAAAELAVWPYASQDLRDLIVIGRDSGVRCNIEGLGIRIEWANLEKGYIDIPLDSTKTNTGERRVPLTPRMRDVIARRAKGRSTGWLFPGNSGDHRAAMDAQFAAAREKAGLSKKLTLYTMRHDFCSTLVNSHKGNLRAVMEITGHASVASLTPYMVSDDQAQLFDVVNNRPTPLEQAEPATTAIA